MIEKILEQYADVYGHNVEDILKQALDQYFSHGSGRSLPKNHVTGEIRRAAIREYLNKKQSFPMNISNPCGPR